VQALRVDAIADSGQSYGGRAFRDCVAAAREHGIPVVVARRGMRYATDDGVALDALVPDEPLLVDGPNDVNENSVVLRMTYRCPSCTRSFRMLFMGDAGAQSEARLLTAGTDVEGRPALLFLLLASRQGAAIKTSRVPGASR
jgi:beta-lactamase superfamily II metal-dependent hydrolase